MEKRMMSAEPWDSYKGKFLKLYCGVGASWQLYGGSTKHENLRNDYKYSLIISPGIWLYYKTSHTNRRRESPIWKSVHRCRMMKRHSNEKEGSKSRKNTIDELDMNRPSGQREEMGDVLLIQFSVLAQKQEAVQWETSVTFDCRLQTRGGKSGKAKALGWIVTSCFFGEEVTKGTAPWGENQLEKLGWEQWHH